MGNDASRAWWSNWAAILFHFIHRAWHCVYVNWFLFGRKIVLWSFFVLSQLISSEWHVRPTGVSCSPHERCVGVLNVTSIYFCSNTTCYVVPIMSLFFLDVATQLKNTDIPMLSPPTKLWLVSGFSNWGNIHQWAQHQTYLYWTNQRRGQSSESVQGNSFTSWTDVCSLCNIQELFSLAGGCFYCCSIELELCLWEDAHEGLCKLKQKRRLWVTEGRRCLQ